jgi:histidinol dehydrogenase
MSLDIVIWTDLSVAEQEKVLQRPALGSDAIVRKRVEKIINKVRESGDAALKEFTRQFDGVELDRFRVSDDEFDQAEGELSSASMNAIELAIANVTRFHEKQVPEHIDMQTMPGVRCERMNRPIDCVGLYVPAGSAPLPSAAIMLAVPAAIAACPQRVMCTPPRPDGRADAAVLVAAKRCGVHTIFKIGGAQAIAAMAYGTVAVPKVDKIFGPGNAWVTTAKSLVSCDPLGAAIDMQAGPTEVLIIADDTASAEYVAADLLAQAEHGEDSQVILITTSTELAEGVRRQVVDQLSGLPRRGIASKALANGRSIIVPDLATAMVASNRYAPEHLIIQTKNPRDLLSSVRNAGSVFLGPWSPEAAGDYCSGTNHVLPTNGFARSYSGLGVDQYLRQMTVQELTQQGLQAIAPAITELARLEGLDAHAGSVRRRLDYKADAESAA